MKNGRSKLKAKKRIRLRDQLPGLLGEIKSKDRKNLLLVLALGATRLVRLSRTHLALAEDVLFNLHTLLYTKRRLRDATIHDVISRGMQLEDVDELVPDPDALTEACINIEVRIMRALQEATRPPGTGKQSARQW